MSDWAPALKDVFSYKNLVHAIAGATGSTVAITVFYPLDTVRTRLQVDDGRKAKYSPELIKEIWMEEGLVGLYRGWFPVVNSIWCSNFVYFYVFNSLKAIAYGKTGKPYPAKDLLLAYLAGVTNVLTTTPLWVANTRLKLQGITWKSSKADDTDTTHYTGIRDALSTIYKQEGLRALWSGTTTSLFLASNPAVHFMVYEALKRNLLRGKDVKELTSVSYFLMGALAKMVATFITYPLQVIQSRLRAGKDKSLKGVKGMYTILLEIVKSKGVQGLYKGLEAKLTQTVLMAALMFLTYEKIASTVFRIMRAQAMPKTA